MSADKSSDLGTRTLTGVLFAAVMLGGLWWNPLSAWILFLLIAIFGTAEFARIFSGRESRPQPLLYSTLSAALYIVLTLPVLFPWLDEESAMLCVPIIFLPFVIELYSPHERPFERIGMGLLGILYVTVPCICFIRMGYDVTGVLYKNIWIGSILLIWANDTFAYLIGRVIGKHPLFPSVSPKKTWEGSIGGIICTLGLSYGFSYWFPELSLTKWLGLGLIFTVFCIWGDLIESRLKRSLNIKDTGTLLPGHGGILDRFDALFFAAPFAWAWLGM